MSSAVGKIFNIGGMITEEDRVKVQNITDEEVIEGIEVSGHPKWTAFFKAEHERRQRVLQESTLSRQLKISRNSMIVAIVSASVSVLTLIYTLVAAYLRLPDK